MIYIRFCSAIDLNDDGGISVEELATFMNQVRAARMNSGAVLSRSGATAPLLTSPLLGLCDGDSHSFQEWRIDVDQVTLKTLKHATYAYRHTHRHRRLCRSLPLYPATPFAR